MLAVYCYILYYFDIFRKTDKFVYAEMGFKEQIEFSQTMELLLTMELMKDTEEMETTLMVAEMVNTS